MNREIKFRAWDDGKMVYFKDIQHLDKEDYEVLRLAKFFCNIRNDSIIMQFTGLKDKNGKEIYEGDWCTAQFRGMQGIQVIQGQIIMDEFMWCIDCTGCVGDDIFSINRPHDFEIIGNIYENPELINQ